MAGNKIYQIGFQLSGKKTAGFDKAFSAAVDSVNALGKNISSLQGKASRIESWQKLQTGIRGTSAQLTSAKGYLAQLSKEGFNSSQAMGFMRRQFSQAENTVKLLGGRLQTQKDSLRHVSEELRKAGLSAKNFGAEQARLNEHISRMNRLRGQIQSNRVAIAANNERKADLKQKMLGGLGAVLPPGIVGAYGAVKTLKMAGDYEHELNKATAIGRLSPEERKRQDRLYRSLGMNTEFTTAQAAAAGVNMNRSGFTTAEIEKSLPAVLNMATASDMGIEETASILSDITKGYGYQAEEMGRVTDIVSKSANIANMDVQTMFDTFKFAVPFAKSLGVSMEDLGAMTGVMADAGIKGSMAGTALRNAFTNLAAPSDKAAGALKKLRVETTDADKNLLPMPAIIKQLNKSLGGLGNAEKIAYLTDIFGDRAATGMLAVLDASESGKLKEKMEMVKDSVGYAEDAAKIMRQGLKGSFKKLTSAVEGVALSFVTEDLSQGITGQIDGITAKITGFAKWLQAHPKFVTFGLEFAKNFVMAKIAIFGSMYAFTQIRGVYLGVKSVVLGTRAAFLLMKGGVDLATLASLRHTKVFKAFSAARRAFRWGKRIKDMAVHTLSVWRDTIATKAHTAAELLGNKARAAAKWGKRTKEMIFDTAMRWKNTIATKAHTAATWLGSAASAAWAKTQKAANALLGAGKWVWATGKMLAYKAVQLAIVGATKAWTAAQWLWNAAMNANPIGLVVTGIAALVGAGYYLYRNWDDIKEWWGALWVKIKKKAAGVIDWFKALPDKIPGWIADIGRAIGNFGATLKEKFFGWIGKIPDDFVDMVKGLPQALKESMAKFGAWVKEQLKDMFTFTFDLNFFGKQTVAGADPNRPLVSAPKGYSGAGLRRNARGGVYSSPTLSLIGEGDSPEYVIPVQGQHKRRGLALWQAAGRDLGVPMMASGGKVEKRSFVRQALENQGLIWPAAIMVSALLAKRAPILGKIGIPETMALVGGAMLAYQSTSSEDNVNMLSAPDSGIMSSSKGYKQNVFITYAPRITVQGESIDIRKTVTDVLESHFEEFVEKIKVYITGEPRLNFGSE
ncbi:phage tail tape measure protein [Pyramidobacter piscolens]|uniref:phage tail tape measure protein n=1 Tax=Pyramidobacter piscolens TaxID=638849 RepID=UPI002AB1B06F|nr:phage tail tape measure protein [Pyramidobacter piscolens]